MHRPAIALVYSFVVILFLGSAAEATQVLHQTPQQLGLQSELVVRGRVIAVESYWNTDHSKIFTRTRVAVDESYKGGAPATVDVVQLGGVVDGMRVTVHGATMWRQDEEVVLFLEAYQPGNYHVTGFSQGKFEIERDPNTGAPFVRRPEIDGLELMTTGPGGAPVPTPSSTVVKRVPINQFIADALGANR